MTTLDGCAPLPAGALDSKDPPTAPNPFTTHEQDTPLSLNSSKSIRLFYSLAYANISQKRGKNAEKNFKMHLEVKRKIPPVHGYLSRIRATCSSLKFETNNLTNTLQSPHEGRSQTPILK